MSNARIFQASYPAERMRGCKFATDFRDPLVMARDGWTSFGAPLYHPDGGAILNGTTDYFTRPLAGELSAAEQTFHAVFYPTFAANDNLSHYLIDTAGGRTIIRKNLDNTLQVFTGATTQVLSSAFATYGSLWNQNGRNVLSASIKTGVNILWLNGTQIDTTATAWTAVNPSMLYVGRRAGGADSYFPGRITRLHIGHHTSTLAEHQAYWNRTMWNWEDRCNINLQFRMQDYDPTLVRTLDSSGHGNHFTLGDGVTPATFPTQQSGRMYFDGGDYLKRASVAQPAGAFSVVATVENRTGAAITYYGDHHVGAAYNWILLRTNTGVYRFYVGGGSSDNAGQFTGSIDSLYHTFVGTWDGTNTNIFVDGVRGTQAAIPLSPSGGALAMRLGQSNTASNALTGTMYDFKYLDGVALTNTQAYDYLWKMRSVIGSQL
jgi:hypothetical protein